MKKIGLVGAICLFGASLCFATDPECCGGAPLPQGQECCNDQPFDPAPYGEGDMTIDVQAIIDLVKNVATATGQCNGNGPGGGSTISYSASKSDICCEGELKTVDTYGGGGTVSVGSFACDVPAPWTIPGIQWGLTIGVSGDITAEVNATGTCEEDNSNWCVEIGLAASLTGGVFAEIVDDDVLRVEATVSGTVTGSGMEWCEDTGLESGTVCLKGTVQGSMTMFSLVSINITGTFYDSCQS